MERGDKLVLTGANGIGKTTLLKSILGLIPSISGKVTLGDYLYTGYFEQEMSGAQNNTCIEELWQELGHDNTIAYEAWPTYDEAMLVENTVEIGVQVNGKVRGVVEIGVDEESDSALAKAKEVPGVKAAVEGKTVVKEIYVKGKIINIVVK